MCRKTQGFWVCLAAPVLSLPGSWLPCRVTVKCLPCPLTTLLQGTKQGQGDELSSRDRGSQVGLCGTATGADGVRDVLNTHDHQGLDRTNRQGPDLSCTCGNTSTPTLIPCWSLRLLRKTVSSMPWPPHSSHKSSSSQESWGSAPGCELGRECMVSPPRQNLTARLSLQPPAITLTFKAQDLPKPKDTIPGAWSGTRIYRSENTLGLRARGPKALDPTMIWLLVGTAAAARASGEARLAPAKHLFGASTGRIGSEQGS